MLSPALYFLTYCKPIESIITKYRIPYLIGILIDFDSGIDKYGFENYILGQKIGQSREGGLFFENDKAKKLLTGVILKYGGDYYYYDNLNANYQLSPANMKRVRTKIEKGHTR